MEIIKIENLTFSYPNCTASAISDVSLSVSSGEFITICGKSGCGKSTLLRHMKPILAPHGNLSGGLFFNGKDLLSLSQREQAEKIGFVMQNPDSQIVTDKVWHELSFGLESLSYPTHEIRARVGEMASFLGIQTWFHKNTNELSGGQKQLLNLAATLVMQPSVVILDEPTAQLDPIAASEFFQMLAKINRELGITVILSEHRLEDVFALSDRIVVMDGGEIIACDSPYSIGAKLTDHNIMRSFPSPVRAYYAVKGNASCPVTVREGKEWLAHTNIGTDIDFADKALPSRESAICLSDIYFRYEKNQPDIIHGLSLTVDKGTLYAIVGGNGTGKTTALSLIGGVRTPYRGKIKIDGKTAMLPQNPQVLFTRKTVLEDLSEITTDKQAISDVISICELDALIHRHPYDLSGGEQQRAALAKVLLTRPDILLLDEPTKGLDAHFKDKLADVLSRLKSNGMTIVAVSHDIEFCAEYADKCGMFFDGGIIGEDLPRAFFSGKSFYTTAANRMARDIIPNAVLTEDIIIACGGKIQKTAAEVTAQSDYALPDEQIKQKKKSGKSILTGCLFFAAYILFQYLFKDKFVGFKNYLVQICGFILLGISFANLFSQKQAIKVTEVAAKKRKLSRRSIISLIITAILIPMTMFVGIYFLGDRKYYFISMLILLESMLPFAVIFEGRKPNVGELVIIAVMSAMSVASRTLLYMLPQFKPVLAMIIISGVCFGGEAGFLVGAITAFVSNFFLSQGPWTVWQMFSMGMVGFVSGILFRKGFLRKSQGSLTIFGIIATYVIYGGIMNPASEIMYQTNPTWEMILLAYIRGIPFDTTLAAATGLFLWFASSSIIEKIERIKVKYGIYE